MRTYSTKISDIERRWWVVDATGKTLGRLSSEVAVLLRGKHKTIYSPHLDTGDFVVIVNAARVRVTGHKLTDKIYYRHSQYPGGLRSTSLGEMMKTAPAKVIEHAVRGMLPRSRLGAAMFKKLKVYAGPDHPHEAQVKASEQKEKLP